MEMSFSSPFRQIEQGWLAGASGPFHERLSTHSWTLFFGILWEEKRDVSLPFPWLKSPASERAIASADDEYTHTHILRSLSIAAVARKDQKANEQGELDGEPAALYSHCEASCRTVRLKSSYFKVH